jgi:hypothetical protein
MEGARHDVRSQPSLKVICELQTRWNFFPELSGCPTTKTFSCYSTAMSSRETRTGKLAPIWRALVEIGFIIFLFYSNLLMGEFTRANEHGKSLSFAILDIFTAENFIVAVISGLIGYVVFEYLRKRL